MVSANKYNKLAGKRVLVFGGTSGIGFCVAEGCLEHGASVIISGTNQEKIQRTISRLRSSYPSLGPDQITGYACDLSDISRLEENLDNLLQKATESGRLNHIAFTAGDDLRTFSITDLKVTDIQPAMAVRLYAVLILAKFIPKYMEISPGSSLSITAGVKTDKPIPDWSLVVAIGGALQALSRGFTVDLQPIRVNTVAPGPVHTELYERLKTKEKLGAALDASRKSTTTGEIGRPEDLAEAYLYIMKDRFVTGEVIRSNGGRLLV